MPVGRFGPMCTVHGCMKPVRELGGFCFSHWAALSPLQRKSLQEDARRERGDTVAFDPLALVEEIAALPEYTGERKFAA